MRSLCFLGSQQKTDIRGGWSFHQRDRFNFLVDNNDLHGAKENQQYTGMMYGDFEPGEILSNRSGSGGGYGDPSDRDPKKVREDVLDGYVSRESAKEDYGVAITQEGTIDWEVTEKLRSN